MQPMIPPVSPEANAKPIDTRRVLDAVLDGVPLTEAEALHLLRLNKEDDLHRLREAADTARRRQAGDAVRFENGASVYLTNLDELQPVIYPYPKQVGDKGSFTLTIDDIDGILELAQSRQTRRIYVSGGGFWPYLQIPGLEKPTVLKTYARLLTYARERLPEARLEGFSPDEIDFLAVVSDRSERYVLELLKDNGLQGLGGNLSTVLDDAVRRKVSPRFATAKRWLETARTAQGLVLPVSAQVEIGHLETPEQRVKHLFRLREAARKSKGQTPLFADARPMALPRNPKASPDWVGAAQLALKDRLKFQAVMRLVLGEMIPTQQVFWHPEGIEEAQECLQWGANALGGTDALAWPAFLLDSRQPSAFTGGELESLIRESGRSPEQVG